MTLTEMFKSHKGRVTVKYEHYLNIYERYFERFKDKPITLIEVGVGGGGSLEMWSKYFGNQAQIIGIDTTNHYKYYENIQVFVGDQGDPVWWDNFLLTCPGIDIFIDDGGHVPSEQLITFEKVFPHLNDGGIYICEDVQTSYFPQSPFLAGHCTPGSFIEKMKSLVDDMNAWVGDGILPGPDKSWYTHNIRGIAFYCYLVIVEKGNVDAELHSPLFCGGQHVQR